MEVTLAQVLDARERRVRRQADLHREYGRTILSFSMNIPGPEKVSPMIRRGFYAGCEVLDGAFPEGSVLHCERTEAVTGCEAMYVLDMEPLAVKTITTRIEDEHGLGRLFDMDVIGPDLKKLDRETVGGRTRGCMVCGAPGRGCASRRVHTVAQLQAATNSILRGYFAETDSRRIGILAVRSLLDEVSTTPKPGLVDLHNSGSHRDMDVAVFRASAEALGDYYRACARIGMDSAGEVPSETFRRLREEGLRAEQTMYAATGGVNTHKGAIFTLGLLCGAAGRLWNPEGEWEAAALFREISHMTREAVEADFRKGGDTAGHRLYREYGIRGIRGEAAEGLPSVADIGLPSYSNCLARGMTPNDAGVRTLLELIARVADTNMISRGGIEGAQAGAKMAAGLLSSDYTMADVERLDDWFIQRNLSPGGCADLLAAVYFVHALTAI